MTKIVVNLTHSFHFEDLSQIEELMKKDGYINFSVDSSPELYRQYAEELALSHLLDMNKEELEEGISYLTEIL